MSRFALLTTFTIAIAAVSNCEAQRPRLLQRLAPPASAHTKSAPSLTAFHQNQAKKFDTGMYSSYRNPLVSRILDGPVPPTKRDPVENNFRYIGGFHQNHFSNIGIPSGDIGIRGNAYNWDTW